MNSMGFDSLEHEILKTINEASFNSLALKIFDYQSQNIPIYREYVKSLPERLQLPVHYSQYPAYRLNFIKPIG